LKDVDGGIAAVIPIGQLERDAIVHGVLWLIGRARRRRLIRLARLINVAGLIISAGDKHHRYHPQGKNQT
jgi:hypothetical protein